MGDRFYMQQQAANGKGGRNGPLKPKRKLKKDIIAEIHLVLKSEVPGLDKLTVASLDALMEAISNV